MAIKRLICLIGIFVLVLSTISIAKMPKEAQNRLSVGRKNRTNENNLSIVQIGVEPTQFVVGDRVHVFVKVVNRGKIIENNVSVNLTVPSQGIDMAKNIAAIAPGEIVEVDFACIIGKRKSELIEVSALVETIAKEKRIRSKTKKVKYNYVYEADGDVVVLYKVEPPVHQWIAFQAYKKLPEGPLKDEIHGYLPTSSSDPYYLPGFDTSGWSNNYNSFYISLRALIEGAWEEDKPFIEGRWMAHYWNPDGGYDDGLYIGFKSALQKAQEDLWQDAISAYNGGQTAQAYYLLGRIAHLLMDMSVPAHTLLDEHPFEDRYEDFTGDNYKNITSSSPNTGIPSGLPSYPQSTPPSYDNDLTKLFYNLAEKSDDFDSDDEDGESTDYGNGKYTWGRNALDASKTFSRAEYFVWTLFGWEKERDIVRYVDYDIFKSCINSNEYHIYYYWSFYDKYNNSLTHWVKVYYTDGSSEFVDWDLEELGGVPDSVLECIYQPRLEAWAIGYVAALYQLFWDSVEHPDTDPLLYNPTVIPTSGTTVTDFEYIVDYHDVDGDPPDYIWVYIDGNPYDMDFVLGSGTPASGHYHYTTTLSSGTHHYSFETEDVRGGYRATETYTGPYVDVPPSGSFEVLDYIINDSPLIKPSNNGDGIFQSGEDVNVEPLIKFNGTATATDIQVSLLYYGSNLDAPPDTSSEGYPDMDPGESSYPETGQFFQIYAHQDSSGIENTDVQVEWEEEDIPQYQLISNGLVLNIEPAAWMRLGVEEWDFGVVKPGDDVMYTLTVSNVGTDVMHVTDIQTSHGDTVAIPTTFTLNPGESRDDVQITIDTDAIPNGTTILRDIHVISDGRTSDPTEDEHLIITGLVSKSTPVFQVPSVNSGYEPDISGPWIVWAEARYGNQDIFAYNVVTGTELQITTDTYDQENPKISGDLIAWDDYRNGGWELSDIYGYDLSTKQEFAISTDPACEKIVGVDNGKVAFTRVYYEFTEPADTPPYISNIWLYDYGSASTTNITGYTSNSSHNPMETVSPYYNDFGGGTLMWLEDTRYWDTKYDPYWGRRDRRVKKMHIGTDQAPVQVRTGWYGLGAANDNRIVWSDRDDERDEQVWLWDGTPPDPEQITFQENTDHGDDLLAFGDHFIVYNKDTSGPFYWDLDEKQEFLLTDQAGRPDQGRMDENGVVWESRTSNRIYGAFLQHPDIAVSSANIEFSDENPYEGDFIDVNSLVRNLTDYSLTEEITVRLYDGDPNDPNTQLGRDEVISGGIAAQGSAMVTFASIPVGAEGIHNMYVCVYVPGGDNPANNQVYKTLMVGDTDTQGPIISNVVVQEFNGNGDGRIEDEERVLISWQATDISGINSSWCTIDANDYAASGTYYVMVGPYAVGNYDFTISATDGDISTETSEYSDKFTVSIAGDITCDGKVNFEDLAVLADQWLQPPATPSADIAPSPVDGFVDFLDFAVLAGNWLWQAIWYSQ